MAAFDLVAIGDTVTDAFIKLKDASVHCDINREKCEICLRFADKVPYEEVYVVPAVGNSANAAVAASRLGLKSALVSNVGDDYFGQECLNALKREKVATDYIAAHPGRKTNYHYVLWYEDDRTILIKHEEYDYRMPDIGSTEWLYLSSLGENSLPFHAAIEKYLADHPKVKLAFQPGTFQIKFGKEALAGIYRRAEVFICNREEAKRILKTEEDDIKQLLRMLRDLGPKIIVITDGPKGAYAYDGRAPSTHPLSKDSADMASSGQNSRGELWFMPPYPDPKPPYERTGAGDAFSSTFVAALTLGMDIGEALRWAPVNSMSVVQQVGARAGLLPRAELEKLLETAPDDYKPKPI